MLQCEKPTYIAGGLWNGIIIPENKFFLIKLNINLRRDPAIPLIRICPWEMKTYIHMKTCMQIFIETLL